jgi:hypothetical protein
MFEVVDCSRTAKSKGAGQPRRINGKHSTQYGHGHGHIINGQKMSHHCGYFGISDASQLSLSNNASDAGLTDKNGTRTSLTRAIEKP